MPVSERQARFRRPVFTWNKEGNPMLRLVMIGLSVAGISIATTGGTADARDGARQAKAAHAARNRPRTARTTRYRSTTTRVAQSPELIDNTKYWHGNTPLDGKAMFDAINDQATGFGE
jgi:hypothetical protein